MMETFPESTSQGPPPDENPSPFPSFGNAGALIWQHCPCLG